MLNFVRWRRRKKIGHERNREIERKRTGRVQGQNGTYLKLEHILNVFIVGN